MWHPPVIQYSKLTIVLEKASRFDEFKLLSGYAGQAFENFIHPIPRQAIDIRTLDTLNKGFLPDTKVILFLGEECLKITGFNDVSLNEIRGYPYIKNDITIIHSYFPQQAFDRRDFDENEVDDELSSDNDSDVKGHGKTKRKNWKWWLNADVQKVKRLLKNNGVLETYDDKYKIEIYTDLNQTVNKLLPIKNDLIFLDVEIDRNKNLTCMGLQIGKEDKTITVVPWKKYDNSFAYSPELFRQFLRALCVSFEHNTIVCHNSSFDLFYLFYRYKIIFPKRIFDTMISWHRCWPEIEKSLGHLVSYFTDLPYHKSDGIFNPQTSEQEQKLWIYNGKDVLTMSIIYDKLNEEIDRLKTRDSVDNANSYVRPCLTMSALGMKLDVEKARKKFNALNFKSLVLARVLSVVTKTNLNPRSPKQVAEYFYTSLGLNCPNPDKPTDKRTLFKLQLKHDIPSIRLLMACRGFSKTASSLKINLWKKDRLTTSYKIAGPDTFRMASTGLFKFKSDKGIGTNVQNQEKKQREIVIADEGKILGQTDQAGAEALIVAYLCRYGRFRKLFLNNIKSHVFVALHVFKKAWSKTVKSETLIDELCKLEPEDLRKHPDFSLVEKYIKESDNWEAKERYYFLAKMICHSCNYDIKWVTFQMQVLTKSEGAIVLTARECKEFIDLYHHFFPEIKIYHYEIEAEIRNGRVLKNLFGEARRFTDVFGEQLWKAGYAFKSQSTVGEITNRAIRDIQCKIDDRIISPDYGLDILQNGHDSIFWQSKKEFVRECKEIVTSHIEVDLVSPRGEKFKMKSETQVGYNWAPASKININGLGNLN